MELAQEGSEILPTVLANLIILKNLPVKTSQFLLKKRFAKQKIIRLKKRRFGSLILIWVLFFGFKPLFDTVFRFYYLFDTIILKYAWLYNIYICFHRELVP